MINMKPATDAFGWRFDNSFAQLPEHFFARVAPTPVAAPTLVAFNLPLAESLGLDTENFAAPDQVMIFSGNRVPSGGASLAQAYAGHQFGHFVPLLGDGRALLLGEHLSVKGERFDIQLKGSGRTPFSRRGDGRATLGAIMREYIIGEALYGLGIPTSRTLAVVSTGEQVQRELLLPGGIQTRVAASHLRIGTFEYFSNRQDSDGVRVLADYLIERHYPECRNAENPYRAVFEMVAKRQAQLVAQWMNAGFIHGVMNTDNSALSGESIDFGPCAFMNSYDPDTVFSAIDQEGRYAYGAQPGIIQWNLARFAEALLPLFDSSDSAGIAYAQEQLASFPALFSSFWKSGIFDKLGFYTHQEEDLPLAKEFLEILNRDRCDYTNSFRELSSEARMTERSDAYTAWQGKWRERLLPERNGRSGDQSFAAMLRFNPYVIARNHRVEEAIEAGVMKGDFVPMERLILALRSPFEELPEYLDLYQPPKDGDQGYRTFCGT